MLRRASLLLFASGVLAAASACGPEPCCFSDEQCGDGLGCFDGRCSYECAGDDDCAPFEICARPADGRAPGVCFAPGEDHGECRVREPPPVPDAGAHDAGMPDAGFDAGPIHDAGRADAGRPDAGFDAGSPDAGFDAGTPDAGFDAGTPDAGFDAGTPDAGFDAGTPDAGFDAGPNDDGGASDAGPSDSGPLACVDDIYEDNNSAASATPLLPSVSSLTAIACPDDPDLYEVPVTAGEVLRVALGYDAPPGMRLTLSAAGQGVLGTSSTGSGLEEVRVVPASSGSVFVRVAAVPTGEARPYGLLFDREAPSGCVDDLFEPNDGQHQATLLTLPADVSARICAPDPDFFQVNPAGASQLTVRFSESPSVGLLLTVLRRSDFAILAVITPGPGASIVDIGQAAGPVLFIVAGSSDADYGLVIE